MSETASPLPMKIHDEYMYDDARLQAIAILLTAHPRQQKWFESVLLSLEDYPGPLVLAYDDSDLACLPAHIVRPFARAVVTGFASGVLGLGCGELTCLQVGFRAVAELDVPYVLKLGFDEPIWRWRRLVTFPDLLAEKGVVCYDDQTRAIFGLVARLREALDIFPVSSRRHGSAESHFSWAMRETGAKRYVERARPWWEERLGLIHLQGEYAANHHWQNNGSWKVGEIWPRTI
ncbi:MAG: hypothetical protein ACYTAN_06870 [Planctomycetota bacterium]|jgi:hypothetical protein